MSKRPAHALVIALSLLVCCGQNGSSAGCTPPPPPSNNHTAAIVGGVVAGAAATAVILVSVNHAHHNLKGCVFESSGGLQLRTEDMKDYSLTGSTTNIAVGNRVHLQGNRQKHEKGAEQVFLVKELKKSYGPCTALATSALPSPSPRNAAPTNTSTGEAHP